LAPLADVGPHEFHKHEVWAMSVEATERPAAGSSFYSAMRILPRTQREAMFEIYRFCRRVDDIADADTPRAGRLAALDWWREEIADIYQGHVTDGTARLARVIHQFELDQSNFIAVIDGVEMDVIEDVRAPALARLDLYCDRVASAVGRLSVKVFGLPDDDGVALAHHLGRALQLTNILRDLDEDAAIGRLYVSRECLLHAGITKSEPSVVMSDPALPRACMPLLRRAEAHFKKADEIMARNSRRAVRAPRLMSKYYHAILRLLAARGFAAPRRTVRLGKGAKLAILLRYAIV
jgi:phytoene synthase